MCMEGAEVNEAVEVEAFVAKSESIAQGGSLPITFDRDGESIDGWVARYYVKQHARDAAIITRELAVDPENPNQWSGLLTSADTVQLAVGLWYVFGDLKNVTTGEARQIKGGSIRFEVTETIVQSFTTSISSVISGTGAVARFNFTGTFLTIGQTVTIAGYTAGAAPYNGDQIVTATNIGGDLWFETIEVFTISQTTGNFTHLG